MLAMSERINLRTNTEIKNLLTRAAAARGLSLSTFLLEAAQKAAQSILKEQEQITLSPRDWEKFAELLDDDAPPNAKLQNAMCKFQDSR